jgi:hypothetical protein
MKDPRIISRVRRAFVTSLVVMSCTLAALSADAQGLSFVPPKERPPLPNIDGLTPDEVREFLGPPFATQVLRDKRLAWSYATPSGVQIVYFRPETVKPAPAGPTTAKPGSARGGRGGAASSPAPDAATALPPNGCRGIEAIPTLVSVAVVMPRTPAFIKPQMQQDTVTTFEPGTILPTAGTTGAWILVRFTGPRGPQVGYVHCTDVTAAE